MLNAVETFHRHHGAAQSMTWSLMMLQKLHCLQAAHMIRTFKNIPDEYIKTQKNTILSRISSFAPLQMLFVLVECIVFNDVRHIRVYLFYLRYIPIHSLRFLSVSCYRKPMHHYAVFELGELLALLGGMKLHTLTPCEENRYQTS